jgi:hypothetical protein
VLPTLLLKFAEFAVGGLAICRLILKNWQIYDKWFGTAKKFVKLQLRNEPKELEGYT